MSYTFVQYFGTFNVFQSFQSARSNYSDNELARLGGGLNGMPGAQTQYLANGTELTIGADFQPSSFAAARGSFGPT
ncbi:MAG: hypothetical protein Q8N26_01050 [Myxococcales bacterium]|nr:hypothetical protein [Myxococcales bacterium]